MHEMPFYFGEQGRQLFGVFHSPEDCTRKTAFVFCHPYAEEKLWAHRSYVSLARNLATHGYPVLRFDFMGHGDSMGDFANGDIHSRINDVSRGIEQILSLSGADSIALFGLRFGGTLAALAAERCPEVSSLVLWQPIVDGGQYMQEVLRSNLSTQMAVYGRVQTNRKELVEQMRNGASIDVDGYPLTGRMYDQAEQVHLDQREVNRSIPALIVQVSRKEDAPTDPKLKILAAQYTPGSLTVVTEEPFWKEIRRWYKSAPHAQEQTRKWVEVHCA
jgi:uncharacterized protein